MYEDTLDLYSRPFDLSREEEERELLRQKLLAEPSPALETEPLPEPPVPEGFVPIEEPPKAEALPEPPVPEGFVELPQIPEGFVEMPEEKPEPEKSIWGKALDVAKEVPVAFPAAGLFKPEGAKAALGVIDKAKAAARRGWLSGDVAMELEKPQPSMEYVAQQQQLIDSLKPDQDFQTAWDDTKTPAESFKAFTKDPVGNIAQLISESMGTMIRTQLGNVGKIPERALQGAVGGAAIGAPLAGVGAGPGAVLGTGIGTTLGMAEMAMLSSRSSEYAGSIMSSLQEVGVDIKDPGQLKKAFSDPQLMGAIRDKAEKKAVPVAILDGLSAVIGGKLFSGPAKTLLKKAGQWATEMFAQGAMGAGGAAGGQLASEGKITSVRELIAEFLVEPVAGLGEVAAGRTIQTAGELAFPATSAPLAPGPLAPPVVPGVTIAPAPGEVPTPPDLLVPPVVPSVVQPPAGAEAVAPPAVPPVPEPPISADTAGEVVVQKTQSDNQKIQQVADTQAQNLQAVAAPKTAEAIQQVAAASNTEASVTAAQFLDQALAQQAVENVTGIVPPPLPVEAAQAPTAAAPAVPPAAPAAEPSPAVAAAPAPAAATPPAGPTPAIVVGGQVFVGNTPAEAAIAAHNAVGPDAMRSAETGWVDPESGRFVTHAIYDAHQALNTAIETAGGDMAHPSVAQAGTQLAEAQARDEELQSQILQPGGEQVVQPGIKGQEVLVTPRPSQELSVPLAGVTVRVEGVTPEGQPTVAERPASQALNDAKNDQTALTILLDCLS